MALLLSLMLIMILAVPSGCKGSEPEETLTPPPSKL